MRRWGVVVGICLCIAVVAPRAGAEDGGVPRPRDIAVAVQRELCSAIWVGAFCQASAYPEPGYRTDDEPHPDQPLAWRVGAVHEHSGYSDGDPDTRPADYFAAARTGHNTADGGGDTGVRVDFLLSSEHSENEKLPVTTAAVCIAGTGIPTALGPLADGLSDLLPPLNCSNVHRPDHYRKWEETLAQAAAATDESFTAMRGFEWTNDYSNHLGVYFSRNVVNAKIDLSYLDMGFFWSWLREPADRGGGDDALIVFNHPGSLPALSPFDGGLPHGELLQELKPGNWDDLAYVPDVDDRVVGIEVNGGEDLEWYVRALTNGWHIGPVVAEDEHEREWSSTSDGKTLVLTRGRTPADYYAAFQRHRTVAIQAELIGGAPGERAIHPSISFYADGTHINDPAAVPLGSTITSEGEHTLHVEAGGLPPGSPVVLVRRSGAPVDLGSAGPDGQIRAAHVVTAPDRGEDWWFAVVCPPGTEDCGTGRSYTVVTSAIWVS
jgi:hypothetical protein